MSAVPYCVFLIYCYYSKPGTYRLPHIYLFFSPVDKLLKYVMLQGNCIVTLWSSPKAQRC